MDIFAAIKDGNLNQFKNIINSVGLSRGQEYLELNVLILLAQKSQQPAIAEFLSKEFKGNRKQNYANNKGSLLHTAAEKGNVGICQILLKNGANIEAKDSSGRTPLYYVNTTKMTKLLVDHGANVNASDHNNMRPLHTAVKKGNRQMIELLLNNGANIEAKDSRGMTPLHHASRNITKLLIKRGANVNAVNHKNITPLHIATERGHRNVVEDLLKGGAKSSTALHIAARNGSKRIVDLLFKNGANVDAGNGKHVSSFRLAVNKRNMKFVEYYLKSDINFWRTWTNRKGYTLLHHAVEKCYTIIVKLLLNNNIDVNIKTVDNLTPLHLAVKRKRVEFVNLLLEHGANVDFPDSDGKTVLQLATETKQIEIFENILKYSPDLNNKSNKYSLNIAACGNLKEDAKMVKSLVRYGFTVGREYINDCVLIHNCVEKGYLEIVEYLLNYGANVNTLFNDLRCFTLLHNSAYYGQKEVIKLLIKYGADLNAKDAYGSSPIFYAVQHELNVVQEFINKGADINIVDKNGCTALHIVVQCDQSGAIEIIKLLLNTAVDASLTSAKTALSVEYINAKAKDGITPLHLAAEVGSQEIIEMLLNYGADIDSIDDFGNTALHLAAYEGYPKAVSVLLENGADINILNIKNISSLDHAIEWSSSIDRTCDTEIVLQEHIVKMKFANLSVNIDYDESTFSIESDFEKMCKDEIQHMKIEKINDSNISYYDILSKNVNQIAIFARNEALAQAFQSDDFKEQFPIYFTMIKAKFRKGLERKKLMDKGTKSLNFLINDLLGLPYNCIEKILNNLSNKDLKIFINACKIINVNNKKKGKA